MALKILCLIAGSYYSFILLASCFVVVPILTGPIGLVRCRVWWETARKTLHRNSGEIGQVTRVKSGKVIKERRK